MLRWLEYDPIALTVLVAGIGMVHTAGSDRGMVWQAGARSRACGPTHVPR
jgi:hypothetical protein